MMTDDDYYNGVNIYQCGNGDLEQRHFHFFFFKSQFYLHIGDQMIKKQPMSVQALRGYKAQRRLMTESCKPKPNQWFFLMIHPL